MDRKILIKIGEIFTKKQNRKDFLQVLKSNIEKCTNSKVTLFYDRFLVDYNEETLDKLKYVFGIQNFMVVWKCKPNIEEMKKTLKCFLNQFQGSRTFKITTKRSWKNFSLNTQEINVCLGNLVCNEKSWKVNLNDPKINIHVEVTEKFVAIYNEKIKGLGGLPVGVNGRVLHLLSGGLDSPVAAWEMMKRGIKVDFLNFITPPHTDKKTIEKVKKIISILNKYQGDSILYTFNYSDLLNLISLTSEGKYKIILMRRSFYRLALKICEKENYLGISNGENLGQVASQTLESLNVIQNVCKIPIYRPVLTLNKIDIIEKSKTLGLYETCILKAKETCELFAPKYPVIRPQIEKAHKLEKDLSGIFELEQKSLEEKVLKGIY